MTTFKKIERVGLSGKRALFATEYSEPVARQFKYDKWVAQYQPLDDIPDKIVGLPFYDLSAVSMKTLGDTLGTIAQKQRIWPTIPGAFLIHDGAKHGLIFSGEDFTAVYLNQDELRDMGFWHHLEMEEGSENDTTYVQIILMCEAYIKLHGISPALPTPVFTLRSGGTPSVVDGDHRIPKVLHHFRKAKHR